jgi:hypothetical protein
MHHAFRGEVSCRWGDLGCLRLSRHNVIHAPSPAATGYLTIVHLLLPGAPLAGWTVDQFKKELLAAVPEFAQDSQWHFKQLANIATRVGGKAMEAIHVCQSELQVFHGH